MAENLARACCFRFFHSSHSLARRTRLEGEVSGKFPDTRILPHSDFGAAIIAVTAMDWITGSGRYDMVGDVR